MRKTMLTLLILAMAPLSVAEVTDSAANGFTTVNEVVIEAGRPEAWVAAVGDVGSWWSSDHTISGDALRLSIQPEIV